MSWIGMNVSDAALAAAAAAALAAVAADSLISSRESD